jgi:CDP-4-dehydro-6-deoxyglucose reductase/3-phenylpropionate/trans-cinnamate dioxygenase ferredoxin reductase subunit
MLTLSIHDVRPATTRARIVRIDLAGARFPYRAGQALLVASHGRTPLRPYSIASAPEDAERDGHLELLVGVDPRGAAGPHLVLEPGLQVDVDGPLGRFTFPEHPQERRFLFIAGGTGIAPLRAMMRHALNAPHQEIGLFYSARTKGEFAYEDEWRELARQGRIEFRQTVTREATSPEDWGGTHGRIGQADLAPFVHDPATLCFICGPPALVDEMPKILEGLGVPRSRIKIEEWNSSG